MINKNPGLWIRIQHELMYVDFCASPRLGDLVVITSHDCQPMQAKVFTGDDPGEDVLGRIIASGSALSN